MAAASAVSPLDSRSAMIVSTHTGGWAAKDRSIRTSARGH